MDGGAPTELRALLEARDDGACEEAWAALLESHTDLLLRAAEAFGGGHDSTMDRYRYVLEGLRRDGFRRLRSYRSRSRSSFEGWLIVVSRRLCLDFERSRYGRGGRAADAETSTLQRASRRKLVDLVGVKLDTSLLPGNARENPERRLREAELREALDRALGDIAPRDRLLLSLRFEDEAPVREIAEVMGFPTVFHVYRRLNRALDGLRMTLREEGFDGAEP